VAVNTMDKLQFLVLIFAVLLSKLCNVSLYNYKVYLYVTVRKDCPGSNVLYFGKIHGG